MYLSLLFVKIHLNTKIIARINDHQFLCILNCDMIYRKKNKLL
jgi:hypothetical protein